MKKSGAFFLFLIVLFIAFIYWYFIIKTPCEPMARCYLTSLNISCTSSNDCFSGSIRGTCDMKTLKCVGLTLEGNRDDCDKMGGEWIEWGCLR